MANIEEIIAEMEKVVFRQTGLHETDKRTLLNITCEYEFEPHGRASETFEIIWCLTFPRLKGRYLNTKKEWVPTLKDGHTIRGRTLADVLTKALDFWMNLSQMEVSHD